ncbi:MAG: MFS transporter [Armatimonadetes bacterium]|nr:MFS transporter [Armatimonadota bacterium]
MSALDGSVVNTALPVIGRATGAPVTTLEWVVLIYLLTVSSLLLVFGRLADIYGQREIYLAGLGIFMVGSVLCGLSSGIGMLIAFRAVQSVGAAMLFALGPAVLTRAFPGGERGRALGLQATVTYLGLSTGPALGGFLTQHLGWPSIFFINVPIGSIVIPVAMKSLKSESSRSGQPFDPVGAAAIAVALATLLLALSKGNEIGWSNPLTVTSLIVAAMSFTAFILVERRIPHPVLDLALFSNRLFAASTFAAFLNYMATASMSFLMPFYLIVASRYPVADAGLVLISTPVVMALVAGPSGSLSDRIGYRIPTTIGMTLTVTGLLLLRTLHPADGPSVIVPHLALIGLGIGLFTSPNNSAIMGSAPRNRQGVAGAILAAARTIGFAIGTAVAGLIYVVRLNRYESLLPQSDAVTRAMQDATSTIALIAAIGIVISAFRGQARIRRTDL